MEESRDVMEYLESLVKRAETPRVMEICGKTYVDKRMERYDVAPKARAVAAHTLTALLDYIENCAEEFPLGSRMIVHIVDPMTVRLMSQLDKERTRETLFESEAEVSCFRFNQWYDQESFMIALQSNFVKNEDLELVMKLSGNIVSKNEQAYADDGISQSATMNVGVASKAPVIVPNPVTLIPFRTFQEVEQPESQFVFRIGEQNGAPAFKLVEAEGGLWRLKAINQLKEYISNVLRDLPEEISADVVVIG